MRSPITPEQADVLAKSIVRIVEALMRHGVPETEARETADRLVAAWWLAPDEPEVPWED